MEAVGFSEMLVICSRMHAVRFQRTEPRRPQIFLDSLFFVPESASVLLKMSSSFLICPLCSQPGFQTLDSLRYGLISAATRQVVCPVCHDILFGLDKFTIHLFSHSVQHQHEGNNCTIPIEISSFRNAAAPLNQQSSSPLLTNSLLVCSKAGFNTKVKDIKECCNSNDHTSLCPDVNQKTMQGSTGCWSKEMITEDKLRMENLNDKQNYNIISDTSEATKKYEPEKSEINAVWEKKSCNNKLKCKYTITTQSSDVAVCEYTQSNSELNEVQTATKSSQTVSECLQRSQVAEVGNISTSLENKPSPPPYHYSAGHLSETTNQNASVHCLVLSSALSQENSTQVPTDKGVKGVTKCDICGFVFEDSSILTIHHQLVHCIESRSETPNHRVEASDGCKQGHTLGEKHQFPCHLCSKAFKMRGSLMVHLRVAHSSGIVSGKSFIRRMDPDNASEERKFSCHMCSKSFKKEQHLQQHLKTHEGKQWECDVCSKLFTTKYFLKKHKRLHTGETPYSCDTCGKTFTFQQSYHKHLLYHSDDKPHVCTECDRAFKELSTLHNHQRIHTGEKPFACETCGKCFRQRVSYLVHRRIHTGVMPYRCTACNKSFRYKVSQRTHKCPSQPPGTVVRQSSDLVQKLLQGTQQKVALSGSQMFPAHTVASSDDRGRNGETQQPPSTLTSSDESHNFPISQQQKQHQQFNDSQFTIIVGSDVQSLFPTSQMLLASGSLYGAPSSSAHVVHSNCIGNSKMKQISDTHNMKEETGLLNKKKNIKNPPNPAVVEALMTSSDFKTDKQDTKEGMYMVHIGNNNSDVGTMNTTDCNPGASSLHIGGSQEEFSHKNDNNTNSILTTGNKLAQDLAFLQENGLQVSAEDELQISACNSTGLCKSPNKRCKSIENLDLVETTDFFTMIMSPSVKSLHSPSEKLRHLTLSSPVDTLLGSEDDGMYQFLMNSADTAMPTSQDKRTCSNSTEPSKTNSKTAQLEDSGTKPLQTINQESLKQLLYGTPGS